MKGKKTYIIIIIILIFISVLSIIFAISNYNNKDVKDDNIINLNNIDIKGISKSLEDIKSILFYTDNFDFENYTNAEKLALTTIIAYRGLPNFYEPIEESLLERTYNDVFNEESYPANDYWIPTPKDKLIKEDFALNYRFANNKLNFKYNEEKYQYEFLDLDNFYLEPVPSPEMYIQKIVNKKDYIEIYAKVALFFVNDIANGSCSTIYYYNNDGKFITKHIVDDLSKSLNVEDAIDVVKKDYLSDMVTYKIKLKKVVGDNFVIKNISMENK